VDFDGKVFSEVPLETGILKYRGSVPVNSLDVFPLQYHENAKQVRADPVECGRKFGSLKMQGLWILAWIIFQSAKSRLMTDKDAYSKRSSR
jgi:hypothetical protein